MILVYMLFPQWLGVPISRKSHCCPIHVGVLLEKAFEFLLESMIGVDGIEKINYHRQNIVNTIITYCPVCEPCILSAARKKRLYL